MYDAPSVEYYRRRELAERELADQAVSIAIRNIHLDMADRYRALAQELDLRWSGQDRAGLPTDAQAAPKKKAAARKAPKKKSKAKAKAKSGARRKK